MDPGFRCRGQTTEPPPLHSRCPPGGWLGLGKLGGWEAAQGARTTWVRALLGVPPTGLEGRMPPSASGLSSQEELRGLMPDVPEDSAPSGKPAPELHRDSEQHQWAEEGGRGPAEGRVGSPPLWLLLRHVCALVPGCCLDTCCGFCRLNLGYPTSLAPPAAPSGPVCVPGRMLFLWLFTSLPLLALN